MTDSRNNYFVHYVCAPVREMARANDKEIPVLLGYSYSRANMESARRAYRSMRRAGVSAWQARSSVVNLLSANAKPVSRKVGW